MFKSFINWLKGGSGSATKQAELDAANAAPYKVEAPVTQEEKIEQLTMQNGDLDAPPELVARAAKLDATEAEPVAKKPARKPKAPTPKITGNQNAESVKRVAKPRSPKKPNMTIAK